MPALPPQMRAALTKGGSFLLRVVPSADWFAHLSQQHQPLPAHESVLRPLLQACSSAWVYEMDQGSAVFASARTLLRRERGKYAINLHNEPIRGHELFWNASGGQRGSIVLTIPMDRFPGSEIFPHCQQAFVVGNSTVAQTPGAVRMARAAVADGQNVCCLLTRTNGFELIAVYASAAALENLLVQARSLVCSATHPANAGAANIAEPGA